MGEVRQGLGLNSENVIVPSQCHFYFPHRQKASPFNDFRTQPSKEMAGIYSTERKYGRWADNEICLAESQLEMNVKGVTEERVDALRQSKPNISIDGINQREVKTRHDVMAYVGEHDEEANKILPGAGGILHLAATSCFATCNAELLLQREGLDVLEHKLTDLVEALEDSYGVIACAGLHYALEELAYHKRGMKARGAKGTTGTQGSYMILFDEDYEKVKELDRKVTKKMGFRDSYAITGQTYPRMADFLTFSKLGLVGKALEEVIDARVDYLEQKVREQEAAIPKDQTAIGVVNSIGDLEENRISLELMEELKKKQLSMLYANVASAADMAADQWLERSIDDSSHRRILLNDCFLAVDSVVDILSQEAEKGMYLNQPNPARLSEDEQARLDIVRKDAVNVVDRMHGFALQHKDVHCLAYTHLQPGQPTTHGKRIAMWEYNYVIAMENLERLAMLETRQVSSALIDYQVGSALMAIGVASAKKSTDIRLLQGFGELAEPFRKGQKGSSAMPHKRNPIRNERDCGLTRAAVAAYLAEDLDGLYREVNSVLQVDLAVFIPNDDNQYGFTVFEHESRERLRDKLPYLAGEPLMMFGFLQGKSRQELHDTLSDSAADARESELKAAKCEDEQEAAELRKQNMIFHARKRGLDISPELEARLLDPNNPFSAAPQQVEMYHNKVFLPFREKYAHLLTDEESEVQV
jgi:adenylosuccinate lyase